MALRLRLNWRSSDKPEQSKIGRFQYEIEKILRVIFSIPDAGFYCLLYRIYGRGEEKVWETIPECDETGNEKRTDKKTEGNGNKEKSKMEIF